MKNRMLAGVAGFVLLAGCGRDSSTGPEVRVPAGGVVLAVGTDSSSGATIETDKDDYVPGEIVHLKGWGWAPGETVHLYMTEEPDTHGPVSQDVVADSTGAFSLHFYDIQTHDLGSTFTLTATGGTSGSRATLVFYDGNLRLQPNPTPTPFSPNGDGQRDNVTIAVANSGSGAETGITVSVRLQGAGTAGAALRTFSIGTLAGNGNATVVWDGKNSSNVLLADGAYTLRVFNASQTEATASPQRDEDVVLDNTPPVVSTVLASPVTVTLGTSTPVTVTATATDALSNVTAAALSIDGGGPIAMSATDGAFDELAEGLTVTIPGATVAALGLGTHQLCVKATDLAVNTTATAVCATVTVVAPDLTITKSHSGSFYQGGTGSYTLTVTNNGGAPTSGTVTVTDILPAGLTATALSGTGWTCVLGSGTCTRSDALAAVNSYPAITLGVSVAPNASASLVNSAAVSGGGDANVNNNSALDLTTINPPANTPPVANAGPDYTGDEGSAVTLAGSATDVDGVADIASIKWTISGANSSVCTFDDDTKVDAKVTCDDNGSWTLTLTVKDQANAMSADDATLTISNVAPTVPGISAPASVNEGPIFSFSADLATDPSNADRLAGIQYAFSCDDGATFSAYGAALSSSCAAPDGPATVQLAVKAVDKDGGESAVVKAAVTVNNVAPTATYGNTGPVNEGSSFTLSLTNPQDPSSADVAAGFEYAFDCGDGGGYSAFGSTSTASCPTADNGVRATRGKVRDKDGGVNQYSANVTVNNVAPTVTGVTAPSSVDEGGSITFSASGVTDPSSADVAAGFEYAFSCNNGTTFGPYSTTNSGSCPADDGPATVHLAVKARDKDSGESQAATGSVTVNNVPPTLASLGGSAAPVPVGTTITVSPTFTDPAEAYDSYTARVNWDDGAGFEAEGAITSGAAISHTYDAAGVYTACAKVSDEDGGTSNTACFEYIVVYDPSAGFVTGGGWIDSPLGAYKLDLALTGKATFGFVSKYLKGANTPTGNTEFQFHTAGLNFKSTSYEWLVVSGPQGQYKGVGTVNGASGFGFMLSAWDGQAPGGGGTDKFRMKIWRVSDGTIVYDNQGGSDDQVPATELGGGSIVVHSRK